MQPPVFGRRNQPASLQPRAVARRALETSTGAVSPDHAAILAAARREGKGEGDDDRRNWAVPRSFRAALLAGLVVGFCLAGLDITSPAVLDPALARSLAQSGLGGAPPLPYTIAVSLLIGARGAATTLLVAHAVLKRAGLTGYGAYGFGGAIAAAAFAGLMLTIGHPPRYGWPLELAAGAGAGFFYRMFAGAKPLPTAA